MNNAGHEVRAKREMQDGGAGANSGRRHSTDSSARSSVTGAGAASTASTALTTTRHVTREDIAAEARRCMQRVAPEDVAPASEIAALVAELRSSLPPEALPLPPPPDSERFAALR